MKRNGDYIYSSVAGEPGAESIHERIARERYWRSLGKKIAKGSRIKQFPPRGDTFGKWLY